MSPGISVNKGCRGHYVISHCGHPRLCTLRFRMEKNRILVPSKDAYQENNFNKPRLLHLPIHRKVLSPLERSVFSLIDTNILMFNYLLFIYLWFLFCKNFFISWFLPHLFGTVPQSFKRDCSQGLKSSVSLLNKNLILNF